MQDESECIMLRNRVYNNRKAAVQVSARSHPTLIANKLFEGKGGGLVVHEDAKGIYTKNWIANNEQAGVGVMDRACPLLTENVIVGNRSGGVVMAGECAPVLTECTITGILRMARACMCAHTDDMWRLAECCAAFSRDSGIIQNARGWLHVLQGLNTEEHHAYR